MTITWRAVPGNFLDVLYETLKALEAPTLDLLLKLHPKVATPTIGIGFDLLKASEHEQKEVFRALGFNVDSVWKNTTVVAGTPMAKEKGYILELLSLISKSSHAQTDYDAIMQRRANEKDVAYIAAYSNRRGTFAFKDNAEVRAVFEKVWPDYFKKIAARLNSSITIDASFLSSKELIALACTVWVGTWGPKAADGINKGDRSTTWFELRYGWLDNDPVNNKGWAKRHYFESAMFGLYGDQSNTTATLEEAKQIYAMLSKKENRKLIIEREAKYGVSADGTNAGNNMIPDAVGDYRAALTAAGSNNPSALLSELKPAYTAFITYANTLHGTSAPDIDQSIISNAAAIYFQGDDDKSKNLDARVDDVRPGKNLSNNLLVGGAGADTLWGGKGADYLMGNGGADTLDGGEGDDILIGGKDADHLNGGAGDDKYAFDTGDGKDFITDDSNGQGSVIVGGVTLVGGADADCTLVANQNQWSVNNGQFIYTLDEQQKRLVISGSALGANNDITINEIDVAKIKSSGYLGITLKDTLKCAIVNGSGTNVFHTTGFDPASLASLNLNLPEGTGTGFTIYLNQAAKAGDTITLSMGGSFQAILGDTKVNANGAVITLTEGQTEATFGLVQEGEVSADASLQLSASFSGKDGSAASNVFGINLKDGGENAHIFNGDQRPVIKDGKYEWPGLGWDAAGNLIEGVAEANFSDVLEGSAGNDKIFGFGGNDALGGGAGNDEIEGGDGDDLIAGGAGSDHILGGNGNDYIFSSSKLGYMKRSRVDDKYTAPNGEEIVTSGATWGVFVAPLNADQVKGGNVTDGINKPAGSDGDYVDGGAGEDTIVTSGGNDYAQGGADNDHIFGLGGNDVLYGGEGKDIIAGDGEVGEAPDAVYHSSVIVAGAQHGDDFIDGGSGNDTLYGDGGNDIIFGGADDDAIWGDSIQKDKNSPYLYLDPAYHGNDFLNGESGNDQLVGGGKDDTLYGGSGNDLLWGDANSVADNATWIGKDYLDGGEGNDQLVGGAKDDTLYGGKGDDNLWGDFVDEGVDAALNGQDYLDGGEDNDHLIGGGNDDILYGGSGDDVLFGDDKSLERVTVEAQGNDYLDGGTGNDYLIGGGGNDSLYGGSGDDFLYGDDESDLLPAYAQGSDYLNGGDGDDQLVGGGGDDVLIGGNGNDTLFGGTGADYMDGGLGDDTYQVDNEGDVIVDVREQAQSSPNLTAKDENNLSAGKNGAINESVSLSGSESTAAMSATSKASVNNVQASVSYTLGEAFDNLFLLGSAAINGSGNDSNNGLVGNAGVNTLDGGAGDDYLDGGAGADTLIGGSGNDGYIVDNVGDIVLEAAGEGLDQVQTSVSFTLSDNVEQLIATGNLAINLTGNNVDNVIYGNAANNVLSGGIGNDVLDGGKGNDIYLFNRGDGQDTINNLDFLYDTAQPEKSTAIDVIRIGVADTDVVAFKSDDGLILRIKGSADQINVTGYFVNPLQVGSITFDYKTDGVEFSNGVKWDRTAVQSAVDKAASNHAPTILHGVPDLKASVGNLFSYTADAATIVDQDVGDTLYYSATMSDGSALPSWLSFDSVSRTFSGTPTSSDLGSVQFLLFASDNYGVNIGTTVMLNIEPNHAPEIITPIKDKILARDKAFSFIFPQTSFGDPDKNDALSYRATQIDGSPLPSWLNFDAMTRSFTGVPPEFGVTSVRIVVSDHSGLSVSDDFNLDVRSLELMGTADSDILNGTTGDDVITGLAGNDYLYGEDGDDAYMFDPGFGSDRIDDRSGVNQIIFSSGITRQQIKVSNTQTDDCDDLFLRVDDTANCILIKGALNKYGDANYHFSGIKFSDGTSWDLVSIKDSFTKGTDKRDSLTGTNEANVIYAGKGDDSVYARGGNDIVFGESGNDDLSGGDGNDNLDGGDGNDFISGGSGNDILIGGAGNDRFYAGYGDDVLMGGAGNDILRGESGNDTYYFGRNQGDDIITEGDTTSTGNGIDKLILEAGVAPVDITLYRTSGNVTEMPYARADIDDLLLVIKGTNTTQLMIVDYFSSVNQGAVESIVFQDGTIWDQTAVLSKLIDRSGIVNTMAGTAGNDVFVIDHALDTLVVGVVGGADKILSSITYILPNDYIAIRDIELSGDLNIDATGNSLSNTIIGNIGNNVLNSDFRGGPYGLNRQDSDTLIGGLGNDTYIVKGLVDTHQAFGWSTDVLFDVVVENSNEGNDTLITDAYNATLPENVENLVLTSRFGCANEGQQRYDYEGAFRFVSQDIASKFIGNDLNNVIDASGVKTRGLFTLDGGLGADTMIAGPGNNTCIVDNVGDVVIGSILIDGPNVAFQGYDTVESSISYSLLVDLDNLVLTGNAQINGVGNALNNVLNGSKNTAANNLTGGVGDDTYIVGAGDIVHENVGEGNDAVTFDGALSGTFSLENFQNIENIFLDDHNGASHLNGNSGNNILTGNKYNNTLAGGAGDDVIYDDSNNGWHYAGNVNIIYGDVDVLLGGEGNDRLYSFGGQDTLDGGVGDDQLFGATDLNNRKFIFGTGYGHDRIMLSNGSDTILLKSDVSGSDVVLARTGQTLQVQLRGTTDVIDVENFFTDASVWTSNNMLGQLQFADGSYWDVPMLITRLQNNNPTSASNGADILTGSANNDAISGLDGNDNIRGDAGNDTLDGNNGDDILIGGDGNDLLIGGTGNDQLMGGTGADTYRFSRGFGMDVITEFGVASSTELDAIEFSSDILPSDVTIEKGEGQDYFRQNLIVKIKGTNDQIILSGGIGGPTWNPYPIYDNGVELIKFSNGTTWTVADMLKLTQIVYGTEQADTLYGNQFENTMFGYAGDDSLDSGDGDDILDGGTGIDTLIGGVGNDTYIVDNSADIVTENVGEGTDLVQSSASYILLANVENLTLTGALDINGTGNVLANIITGNAGNNVINGGAGIDIMLGGAGDDIYVVDNAADLVTEYANEGSDLVQSSVTYALASNIENLTLTGTAATKGTGNSAANTLTGNSGNNVLDGGSGIDLMIGGAGNDTYVVDNTADVVNEAASAGTDLVQSSASYTLATNVENLTLTGTAAINGTGNAQANILTGNNGNNILDGGTGVDTLIGGMGDDTYVIDTASDIITELANAGIDTVLSAINYTLGASSNLENLTLTGTAATGTGNNLANILIGNSSANTLDGGAGIDTLIGGAGNDIYVVDNSADVVTENLNEGSDLVNSSATYTLSSNLENLTLTGTSAINGTGNALANTITGNSGNNILDGGAGIDSLIGGAGNDIYLVDNTADVVTEVASGGTDLVQAWANYTLSNEVENLSLMGSASINGTGNSSINILTGNSGNNILNGGAGADTMIGGAGNDSYLVDSSSDIVTENAGEGSDQVQSSATYILSANIEALFLTGTGSINGTGNAIDNLLVGNSGINTLNGAAGNDILQGAAGVDTLSDTLGNNLLDGGAGNDIITAGVGNDFVVGGTGNDTITTGQGVDVIAFNRGDGMDVVNASTIKDNSLSLGKGIKYADLLFKKSANDLILVTGVSEQITVKDWYANTANHSIANLQIVIEGTSDYVAASTNKLNNKKIEQFNFDGLVTKFDQARAATPSMTSWALSASLLEFYLAGSDTAAIGGDLAYQYAKNGNLSNFSMTPAQSLLASPQFGSAQGLQNVAALQDASPRLI